MKKLLIFKKNLMKRMIKIYHLIFYNSLKEWINLKLMKIGKKLSHFRFFKNSKNQKKYI